MSPKIFDLVWLVLALTSAAAGLQYQPFTPPYQEEYYDDHPSYSFKYKIEDDYGNNYGQEESRDGYETTGAYYVLLPDGRTQWVRYYVTGDSGFVAEVSYDGESHYDHPKQPGSIQEGDKPYGFGHGSPAHPSPHGPSLKGNRPHALGQSGHRGHIQKVDRPYGLDHATPGHHHDRKLHPTDPHSPLFYGAKINPYTPGSALPNHGSKNRRDKYPYPRHSKPHHKKPYTPGQPQRSGIGAPGFRNPQTLPSHGIHHGRNDLAFHERVPTILGSHPRDSLSPDFYPRDNPVDAFDDYPPRNSNY